MKTTGLVCKNTALAFLMIAMTSGLAGCSKVNRENYDKLKMGMDYGEVIQILGEPANCDNLITAKSCVWGKAPKTITVQLIGDKVILFQGEGL
ncbi:DUF3862 domain-containing protein [Methylomagnum sp.]